jgi:hypothetical protein
MERGGKSHASAFLQLILVTQHTVIPAQAGIHVAPQ